MRNLVFASQVHGGPFINFKASVGAKLRIPITQTTWAFFGFCLVQARPGSVRGRAAHWSAEAAPSPAANPPAHAPPLVQAVQSFRSPRVRNEWPQCARRGRPSKQRLL